MTNQELKQAIFAASVIGTKSAIENLPRVPHHNNEFRNFISSLPIQEMNTENLKKATLITKAFSENYTMQLFKEARQKLNIA